MSFASHLENRGVISLGGEDRHSFLQGLISNDVNLCTDERAIYAALLTPQGKFLFDLFVIEDGEVLLIDCERAQADHLMRRLSAYKLRAKVTMQDLSAELDVWATGDQGSAIRGQKAYRDPRLEELGWREIVGKKDSRSPISDLRAPFSVYDKHRLALGVADGGRDMIVEKSTLAEGNFDLLNGVSWSKGCYVGQELTARMHYRALAKKRLFPVKIEGVAPAFGTPVMFGSEEIGDMRSSAADLGLALLNIEKADQAIEGKTALVCASSRLTVSKPEWMEISN